MAFDRYGRYLVTPADGGKPVAHTRATTHAATCDDRYALEKWGQRMVAIGLSRRPDLLAQVAAAPDDDKTRLDTIVADAIEAADASAGRNIGDALHQFTERVDRGDLDIGSVPDPWRKDIDAYRRAMDDAELLVELIEQTVVIPSLTVAGTLDRIVTRDGRRFILDVKTGQKLDYSWGSIAQQLAIYSRAETIYDLGTGEHSPMPAVDQEVGLVAHVPAGKGTCHLIGVDLEAGWRGALLAHDVRRWRKDRFRLGELTFPDLRDQLAARVRHIVDEFPDAARDLANCWPSDVPTFRHDGHDDEQLDRIARAVRRVEADHRVPFRGPDPFRTTTKQERTTK
jgi:hypothetical protein